MYTYTFSTKDNPEKIVILFTHLGKTGKIKIPYCGQLCIL